MAGASATRLTRAAMRAGLLEACGAAWVTNVPEFVAGTAPALFEDARMEWAAQSFAGGRLDGARVLVLGGLEGAHAMRAEALGAAWIDVVEPERMSLLKALAVKEALGLGCRLHRCEAALFLRSSQATYDLVFSDASLGQAADPIELIKQICLHASRCFVWTNVHDPDGPAPPRPYAQEVEMNGLHARTYAEAPGGAAWLDLDGLVRCFAHFGLAAHIVHAEVRDFAAGAHVSVSFRRDSAGEWSNG